MTDAPRTDAFTSGEATNPQFGAPGLAMSVAMAVAGAVLIAIVVATALTGPAGAAAANEVATGATMAARDLADAAVLPLAPARDAQFVVVDPAGSRGTGTGAMVLLIAMMFGMATAAGLAWRAFTRALIGRPVPARVRSGG
jgi:hypothetical protein